MGGISFLAVLLVLEFLLYQNMAQPTSNSVLGYQSISSHPKAVEEAMPEEYPSNPVRVKRNLLAKRFQVVGYSSTLFTENDSSPSSSKKRVEQEKRRRLKLRRQ